MNSYRKLVEIVAQRQFGILGEIKTAQIFQEVGLELDGDSLANGSNPGYEVLQALLQKLYDTYGPVPIMGCKIPLKRKAKELNILLPELIR